MSQRTKHEVLAKLRRSHVQADAAQGFRLDQQVDYLRHGYVFKTTREMRYGVLTLTPKEATPDTVLAGHLPP